MITQQGQRSDCCNVACLQSSVSDPSGIFTQLSSHPLPTVSIGLPVFNGENFVAEAIESVLAQTLQSYELIISDNASTDRTREICLRYVRKDARVRYFRSPTNRGPAWNYNRVFALARGTYFKWAAHDDVFEPRFLETVLAALVDNPAAVLSFSQVDIINENSKRVGPYAVEMALDSQRPAQRFQETISLKHRCYEIFGLVERSRLAQTNLIGPYAGSDRVLLSRLSLQGAFAVVPEPLFKAREHEQQSIEMLRSPRKKHLRMHDYAVWFDPLNRGRVLFPNWRILGEYISAVWQAPISTGEKISCGKVLLQWLLAYNNVGKLARDVAIAAVQMASRPIVKHKHKPLKRTLQNWNRGGDRPHNSRHRPSSTGYQQTARTPTKSAREQR